MLHRMKAAVAVATLVVGAGAAMPTRDARAADADPLVALNKSFRQAYASERSALLNRGGPVIVVAFDDLVLMRAGKTEKAGFTPAIYHEAKSIAHVPLTLYVWLQSRTGKTLDDSFLDRLRAYRGQITAAAASLSGRSGWTRPVLAVHQRIIDASLKLIAEAEAKKTVSGRRLAAYARAMRPLVLRSADVAARAQLDGLDRLARQWRKRLGRDWARTKVVVLAPRQARRDNLQYLYFRALMGRAAEGKRLFYGTNIFSASGGQRLIGTIVLDRGASVAFFRNPTRLERDLLGDAAKRHITRLFARRR